MSEIVRTADTIAAEIRALTASMLNGVIEIGRRMVEAKAILPHGEFGRWIAEETGYSSSTASNFMRIFEEYGASQGSLFGASANCQTIGNLPYSKALALLDVPAEERESFAVAVHAEEISTRELKEAIRERDDAIKAAAAAKARENEINTDLQIAEGRLEDALKEAREQALAAEAARKELEELKARPVDVAVERDEDAIRAAEKQAAEAERQKWKDKLSAAEEKAAKARAELEEKLKKAEEAAEAASGSAEIERLRGETERLRKQLSMSGEAETRFRLHFEAWQDAYKAMQADLAGMEPETAKKMRAAIKAQMGAWNEA